MKILIGCAVALALSITFWVLGYVVGYEGYLDSTKNRIEIIDQCDIMLQQMSQQNSNCLRELTITRESFEECLYVVESIIQKIQQTTPDAGVDATSFTISETVSENN